MMLGIMSTYLITNGLKTFCPNVGDFQSSHTHTQTDTHRERERDGQSMRERQSVEKFFV